jgi:glucose-6-phosphate dehydrogenase assembly protein OpcA
MSATLSPDAIVQKLSKMWTGVAKQDQSETAMGVLRACSMTLVIVAKESESAAELSNTIKALMPEYPARTIVIYLHRGPVQLDANVTAQCWLPFGQRRQICCEQIEITASEDALGDAASVVSPITAPDLPVVLWCRNVGAFGKPEFADFAAMARKVIVNTTTWPDPKAALERLAAAVARGMTLGDLSWTHLTRWREMLSQLFENPCYTVCLSKISRIHVRFGKTKMSVMARYWAAWVKNALESIAVPTELVIEQGANAPAVELSGGAFRVELVRQGERLVTSVNGISHCTNLPEMSEHLLMREELRILRRDPVFEQTLSSAARL